MNPYGPQWLVQTSQSIPFNFDREVSVFAAGLPAAVIARAKQRAETENGVDAQDIICNLHQLRAWAHAGCSRFQLTDSASAAFVLTKVDDAAPPLPFDAFLLESPLLTDPVLFTRTAHLGHECLNLNSIDSRGLDSYSFVRWPDGVWGAGVKPIASTLEPEKNAAIDANFQTALKLCRGLCSFLASRVEPLVAVNAFAVKKDRDAQKAKRAAPVFVVGRSIKLSPELRRAATVSHGSPLWKLSHRYTVMGHWRWQPVGRQLLDGEEGPREAKKIWIMPHWRGPEGAEAWQHVYDVDVPAQPAA